MENILQTILEEIRGVKEDVRNEMQGMKVQNEILRELERNRAEHESYNTRLHKIELTQSYMEEKLLKSS